MRRTWQIQEAKNHFSEVVERALREGPQTVTRHGKEVVVIVAKTEFDARRRANGPRGSIVPFLRKLAFRGTALDLERARDADRDTEL